MESKNYKPNYLACREVTAKCFEIMKTLEGIPMGHALFLLRETKALMLDCHVVDFDNDQFRMRFSEHVESLDL